MAIKIAYVDVLKALMAVPYHPRLIDLTLWMSVRFSEVIITSGWRPEPAHRLDSGIHCTQPCRALDFRSTIYTDPQSVVDDVNAHWQYDYERPERKCAIYHDVGLGPHIHVQVHENTKERR